MWKTFLFYEVKFSLFDAIYIGNTRKTFNKRIDGHFSDIKRLLKNGQKSDSFSAHFEQHFKSTMSRTDLHKLMTFKLVNELNQIGAMKSFLENNFNLCMEERLTILKKLSDKCVTLMNKYSEIYGAYWRKNPFGQFFLRTDDPVNAWKGCNVQHFSNLGVF